MDGKKKTKNQDQEKNTSIRDLSAALKTELDAPRLSFIRRTYLMEKIELLELMDDKSK